MKRFWVRISVVVLMSLVGASVLAQEATCPAIVQAALDATDEQCSATGRNEACYGNINLEAIPQAGVETFTFSTPGDIVPVSAVQNLTLSSRVEEAGEWGIALLQLQANLPESLPGQNVTFLLFGAVEITNGVETNVEPITFNVVAQGDSNVHSVPSAQDAVLTTLAAGQTATAVGRNADSAWVQVALADGSTGWVTAAGFTAEGDITTLNMTAPVLTPMQAFYFNSGTGDAPCAEAPDSGILVQTPEGAAQIQFIVNDVSITLSSTAYLQAQPGGDMTTSVVEGEATVTAGGASVDVPAGSFVTVPLDQDGRASGAPSDPQPYDPAQMAVLPVRILPRAITIADPIGAGGAAILPAAGEWTWTNGTPSQEGCPAGTVEFVVPVFTPRGPFQLPGDAFSLEILLGAAFGPSSAPPGAEFSSPEPNTYVVDFSDGGGDGHYEVRVIDAEHIEGQLEYTSQGCSMAIPFTVTGQGAAGIVPAPGQWAATWDPPSITCDIDSDQLETLTWDMSYYASFQLPADEFSAAVLYGAIFGFDLSGVTLNTTSPESNTHVLTFSHTIGDVFFEVHVTDNEHMEGNYELTKENCLFAFSFEMTRVGD